MIRIKTSEQILGIRRSCQLAAAALQYGLTLVKSGISTEELNATIYRFIKDNGGESATKGYHGYPKEMCISLNEEVCHGIPSDKRFIKDGDVVKIDVTTIVGGYFGDTCGTVAVGHVDKLVKRFIEDAQHCRTIGINCIKPGVPFSKIGTTINRYANICGYSVVKEYCGHGVGVEFHEEPQIHHYEYKESCPVLMAAGMVFTVEPMLNRGVSRIKLMDDLWTARTADGKLSAQFEHTVLVTDNGFEILT